MFIEAVFVISRNGPDINQQVRGIDSHGFQTPEYFSAIRKNELLIYVTTRIILKIIVLSEKSQKKTARFRISFIYNKRNIN